MMEVNMFEKISWALQLNWTAKSKIQPACNIQPEPDDKKNVDLVNQIS